MDQQGWLASVGSLIGGGIAGFLAKAFRTPRIDPSHMEAVRGVLLENSKLRRRLEEIESKASHVEEIESKASQLRTEFNTFRDVEFPSHANRIRSIEIACREVQDRQNELQGKVDDVHRIVKQINSKLPPAGM